MRNGVMNLTETAAGSRSRRCLSPILCFLFLLISAVPFSSRTASGDSITDEWTLTGERQAWLLASGGFWKPEPPSSKERLPGDFLWLQAGRANPFLLKAFLQGPLLAGAPFLRTGKGEWTQDFQHFLKRRRYLGNPRHSLFYRGNMRIFSTSAAS
jgi:hypothetical protein